MLLLRAVSIWGVLVGAALWSSNGVAGVEDLSVTDLQMVSAQRVGRTLNRYSYTITVNNAGGPLDNVVATVVSQSGATTIDEDTVVLGDIGSGSVQSTDTFTFTHNRRYVFDVNNLVWSFTADEPAGNNPPMAVASAQSTIVDEGDTVSLDGSSSSDPDEDPLSYLWSLSTPAGSSAALSNPTAQSPTFVADVPGVYTATLVVNDGDLDSAADSVSVTANAVFVNTPPVADAGPDQQANVGESVVLSGAGSSDIDEDPLTYAWSLQVPSGSSASLSDSTVAAPTFVADVVGTYLATLVVHDGTDPSAPDTAEVTVVFTGENPPSITSQPNTQGSVGEQYIYDVDAVDPDVGDTLTYSLQLAPAGMTINPPSGLISWVPGTTGPADVDVLVTDSTGLTARQIYLVTVNNGEGDEPPVLDPIADQSTVVDQTMMLTATGTDPEGEDLRYGVSSSPDGLVINTTTGELFWTPDANQVGMFAATVTVTDPGGQSDSQSFAIEVLAEIPNNAPTIDPVADQSVNAQNSLQVTLTATDPDPFDVLTFSLSGAPSGMQFDPASATLFWIPGSADAGTVNLTGTVTDSNGNADSTSFTVTVLEPQLPPVAVNDAYTIDRDLQLQVPADGVLTNDTDPNNDVLSAADTSPPMLGTLDSFPGNGAFDYTPPANPPITLGMAEKCRSPVAGVSEGRHMPIVGDIDADGEPEIINFYPNSFITNIFVMDGDCNIESHVQINSQVSGVYSQKTQPALINLDADPQLELVVVRTGPPQLGINRARLVALNQDGSFVWTHLPDGASEAIGLPVPAASLNYYDAIGPTIADIDADGTPEILMSLHYSSGGGIGHVSGVIVYNADGTIKAEIEGVRQIGDSDNKPLHVVDLDLDGMQEIIYHTNVYRWNGTGLELAFNLQSDAGGNFFPPHLSVAIANFDTDPFPEIVARDTGFIYLFEHTGGTPTWQIPHANGARSEITVGEFDGDIFPEFVMHTGFGTGNNASWLTAFDTDGSVLWTHQGTPHDGPATALDLGWSATAFDFDRDGIDELVIPMTTLDAGDNLFMFRGDDGTEIAQFGINLATNSIVGLKMQFPPVVDIDQDGAAEVLFLDANTISDNSIVVLEGLPGNPYPPARPIKHQRNYQPTQVNPDGSIPSSPRPHWLIPGLNKYHAAPVLPFEDPGATDSFNYVANDGTADSNEATVTIAITNVNAPTIISTPVLGASPDFPYQYGLLATDGDFGDEFTWTLVDAPTGMTVNALGIIDWLPQPGDLGNHRVHVVVTDLQGNSDEQSYAIAVVPPTTVPELVGTDEADAAGTIEGANLAVGKVTQSFSFTVPAGEIISQSLIGSSQSAAGAFLDYVVSLGPPPIYVPDLAQLSQSAAQAVLEDDGLLLGAVTLENSDSVPAGLVISQGTAPTTQVSFQSSIDVTISSGPSLEVETDRAMVGSGGAIALTITAFDSAGNVVNPQPQISLTIVSDEGALGTPPTASTSSIATSADTRGPFTLEVDAGVFGTASVPFIVRAGLVSGDYFEPIANLAQTIDDAQDTYTALVTAVQANDLPAIQALGANLIALRDSIDLEDLQARNPSAPESGFIPTSQEAAAAGFPVGFGESEAGPILYANLEQRIEEAANFLDTLNPSVGRDDDLRARSINAALQDAITAFMGLDFSVGARAHFNAESYVLLAHLVPRLVHADLAAMINVLQTNGLLAAREHRGAAQMIASSQFYATEQATFFTLGGMMSASAIRSQLIQDLYVPHIKRLVASGLVLAEAQALIAEKDAGPISGLITGSSLALHVFKAPNSVAEILGLSRDSRSFNVKVIGPDKYQAWIDFATSFSIPTSFKDVEELAQGAANAAAGSLAGTQIGVVHDRIPGCVIEVAQDCSQLVFGFGFPVVHTSGQFPAPAIIVVHDRTQGKIYAGVFAFFPN